MTLTPGDKLGPYEIQALIGKGGMGEVYRAHDPRVNRDVAIKVSAERFSERFEREARVIASLNHPNICQLYDVGPNYLVMELVEGPTLAERIKQGPIPLEESLAIARQIADALDAAQEKAVVHRDLKPGNVKIRPDGVVKVLDFGLAKVQVAPASAGEDSPTVSMGATQAGVILGTAAYMAPEQARGKAVDKRADIWAFGVVLYEMITGKRLFQGDDLSELVASVIKEEPRWDAVPARVQPLLKSCLQKDPKRRLRDIGDVWRLLEESSQAPPPGRPLAANVAWIAAVLGIAIAAVLAFIHFREAPPAALPVRLQIPVPEGMTFNAGTFALSPDGRRIAFGAAGPDGARRLWVRDLDSLEMKPLTGTDIGAVVPPPFWSPDSRYLAFASGGKLKKVEASGGPPQSLCDVQGAAVGGSWNKDGVLIFGSNNGALTRCSASGGAPSPVTALLPGETAHRVPQFLPDGRHFLYTRTAGSPEKTGVYVGSLDVMPDKQDTRPFMITDRDGFYAPSRSGGPGWFLFVREGTLLAQPFDPGKLQLSGEPSFIANSIASYAPANHAFVSVSNTDVLVYRAGGGGQLQLTWIDAQGTRSTVGDPGDYRSPAVSPDGTRIAVTQISQQGNADLWLLDPGRGTSTRLTFDPGRDEFPVWSPDSARIIFGSNRAGHMDLYQKAANGSGEDQVVYKSDEDKIPESWSRDGRYLLYRSVTHNGDLWILPLEGERKPVPFLHTEFFEGGSQFSPDGRWIAYTSNESGSGEIYVRPFSPASSGETGGGKWMVSKGGGTFVHWRADGKQLFYTTQGGTIMAVDVTAEKTFQFGIPRRLFDLGFSVGTNSYYGMTADGKRFLFPLTQSANSAPAPFTVLLNWQAGLKK